MKNLILSMSTRTKNVVFGGAYFILVLAALCPPLYFWASGNETLILGAPIAIWYWIADFVLLLVVMFGLYWVENIRGEVDPAEAAYAVAEEE